MFPGIGKDFSLLNAGMSPSLCTFASASKFPAEFPLLNLHSSLKKPSSTNLEMFHPTQL